MDDEQFYALVRRALNEGFRIIDQEWKPAARRLGKPTDVCIEGLLKRLDMELRLREHEVRFAPAGGMGRR